MYIKKFMLLISTIIFLVACSDDDEPDFPKVEVESSSPLHLRINPQTGDLCLEAIWMPYAEFLSDYNITLPYPPNPSLNSFSYVIPEEITIPDSARVTFKSVRDVNSNTQNRMMAIKEIAPDLRFFIYSAFDNNGAIDINESYYDVIYNNLLRKIEFNSQIEVIPASFKSFLNLETVILKKPLKIIGSSAFRNCKKLKNITIPETVDSIGEYAFSGCSSIKNITFPPSVVNIGSFAFRGISIKQLHLPKTIKTIGQGAFQGCDDLQSIIVEMDVVKDILNSCKNLETIECRSKRLSLLCSTLGCDKLKDIIVYSDYVIKAANELFYSHSGIFKIHVKKSLKEAYEADEFWSIPSRFSCLVFDLP